MRVSTAQTIIIEDSGMWFTSINKYKITDNFYATSFIEFRSNHFAKKSQYLFLSPGIGYKLGNHVSFVAGYMFVRGYVHYDSQSTLKRDENRLWQKVSLKTMYKNVAISNRFVFEERFKSAIKTADGRYFIDGTTYAQRFRYRLTASFKIVALKNSKYLLGKVSNELRIRFRTGISEPDFDQNNFNAYLGYQLFENSILWVGFQRDYYKVKSETFKANNILNIKISYDFDFRKKAK